MDCAAPFFFWDATDERSKFHMSSLSFSIFVMTDFPWLSPVSVVVSVSFSVMDAVLGFVCEDGSASKSKPKSKLSLFVVSFAFRFGGDFFVALLASLLLKPKKSLSIFLSSFWLSFFWRDLSFLSRGEKF